MSERPPSEATAAAAAGVRNVASTHRQSSIDERIRERRRQLCIGDLDDREKRQLGEPL
jgi:hypothetical protein